MIRLAFRRPRYWGLIITLIILSRPYYLMLMMVRYRLPIEPLLLLTAQFLNDMIRRFRTHCRPVAAPGCAKHVHAKLPDT